jgi:hypothetical protein
MQSTNRRAFWPFNFAMRNVNMSSKGALTILAAASTIAASSPTAHRARPVSSLSCQAPTTKSSAVKQYLQLLVSDTSSADADTLRAEMGLPGRLDTAQVSLVSADSVCTRVTQAVDSAFARSASPVSLIVFKIGSSYAAHDQRVATTQETGSIHIVDSAFTYITTIGY